MSSQDASAVDQQQVMLDALRMELEYYRNFFWSHQEVIRNHAADPVQFDLPDADCDTNLPRPLSVAVQLQICESRCRALDKEAATLHEHYRLRVDRLDQQLREAHQREAAATREVQRLREVNHVLCRSIEHHRRQSQRVETQHVLRVQLNFLVQTETLWRLKIELEALRYLTLRAMEMPTATSVSALSPPSIPLAHQSNSSLVSLPRATVFLNPKDCRSSFDRVGASSVSEGSFETATQQQLQQMAPLTAAALTGTSSRYRLSLAVSNVYESFFTSPTTFGSVDWASVIQAEAEFFYATEELRQRISSPASALEALKQRQIGLERSKHFVADAMQSSQVLTEGNEPHRKQQRMLWCVTTRRGLSDRDETLIDEAIAAYAAREGKTQREDEIHSKSKQDSDVAADESDSNVPGDAPVENHTNSPQAAVEETFDNDAKQDVSPVYQRLVAPFYGGTVAAVHPRSGQTECGDTNSVAEYLRQRYAQKAAGGAWLPAYVTETAQLLDPVVSSNQKLRAEVSTLRREKEDALQRAEMLASELKSLRDAQRHQKFHALRGALSQFHPSVSDSVDTSREHKRSFESPRSNDAVVQVTGPPSATTLESSYSPPPQRRSEGAALPSDRVIHQLSEASVDMKAFESIAKLSKDPALRGRMVRQMKELHKEVAALTAM